MIEEILGESYSNWAEKNSDLEFSFVSPFSEDDTYTVEFSPYELVFNFVIPERFAIHYAPSFIHISNILREISNIRTKWKSHQLDLELKLRNVGRMEKELYLSKRASGMAHTEAQKSSSVEADELSSKIQEEINETVIIQEQIQTVWFYFHAIREVIDGYRQLFPHVQDFLSSAHEQFLRNLADVEAPDDDLLLHDKAKMHTVDL